MEKYRIMFPQKNELYMYPSITSQIGRPTVFWCKIKPICVCYENHIMHYQNPIFLTQLRNNGIIPVQDGQVQRYWSISRKPEKHIDYLICRRGLNHLLWSISLLHLCISVIFLMEMGNPPWNPPCGKKNLVVAPWQASAMSEWHSHVLQIWALQMFIWRH
jgi:hypothetical protein